MNELTKEQKYTIAKFYKLYIERSNNGETETVANFFGNAKDARENYFCDRDYQDFLTNCQILICSVSILKQKFLLKILNSHNLVTTINKV
ncbi:TPA: hypothetical protein P0R22_000499 [Staphylococcus aureus]|nr:hypothetical protein [Staphylococcus aureus]